MKVLITCSSLDVEKFKGLARVSLELIKGLEKRGIDIEVYEVHGKIKKYYNYFKNLSVVPLKQLSTKANIYHSVAPESATFQFLRKNSIVTVHDFIPYTQDIKFKDVALAYTTFMWGNAIRFNKVIIANSSLTAKLIEKIYERKAIIINPGVDEKFKPLKNIERKYIGFFANFSLRKGLDICVQAYRELLKVMPDAPKLMISGGKLITIYQKQFDVKSLIKGIEDKVVVRDYISEEKIVEHYNSFRIFCFPSRIEGYGIPILEAQACGVPTLVLKNAIIPEEVRKKAVKCKDVKDMALKMKELLENKKYYNKVAKEGMEYAKRFSWDNFIEKHIEIYENLVRK